MRRFFLHFSLSILLFGSIWYALSQINWIGILGLNTLTQKTEKKLEDILWEAIQDSEEICSDSEANEALQTLWNRLCKSNQLDPNSVQVHLVINDEMNAFALPGGHILIHSGLIQGLETPEELAGVLGHEVAHVQLNHISKKMAKEVGVSLLLSAAGGGSAAGEAIKEILSQLSSSAYDRGLEKEADLKSVEYLKNAGINPNAMIGVMEKLETEIQSDLPSWLGSHPDLSERKEYLKKATEHIVLTEKPVLDVAAWEGLKTACD
ncbi:MAG: M48 family metallopeptidase [Bacteroidetes bacterium]|nr:M48 family metallopeptidase [Bacteroidota bacterium]